MLIEPKRCGKIRTSDIPKSFGSRIIEAREETPSDSPGTQSTTQSCRDLEMNTFSSTTLGDRALDSSRPVRLNPDSSRFPTAPHQGMSGQQSGSPATSNEGRRFINFIVRDDTPLLSEIESQHHCDKTAFREIRRCYNKAKGIKHWFTRLEFDRYEWFQVRDLQLSVQWRLTRPS